MRRPVRVVIAFALVAGGLGAFSKSDPPMSGKHYGSPDATGAYSTNPPEPEQLVHNLEHGQTGDEVVQSAKAFAQKFVGKGPEGDLPGKPLTG